jgi:hypothetical protein
MRYAQIRFTDEEFIELKKRALDNGKTFEELLKDAVVKEYIDSLGAVQPTESGISSDSKQPTKEK